MEWHCHLILCARFFLENFLYNIGVENFSAIDFHLLIHGCLYLYLKFQLIDFLVREMLILKIEIL